MLRHRRLAALAAIVLGGTLLSGCAPQWKLSAQPPATWKNPPFTDSRGTYVVNPDSTFDTQLADPKVYGQVRVYDAAGQPVILNAASRPLLFEAYWCPHCQRTLVLLHQHQSQISHLPILVSMGFSPGTTLAEAQKLSKAEFQAFHLTNFQVYYLLDTKESKQVVKSYPTLAFSYHGELEKLVGEHTLPIWLKALNPS